MNCAPLIPNPFSPSDWHNPVESWNPTNWCHAFPCRARRTKPRFRNSVISHSGPHVVLKRKSPLASQKPQAKSKSVDFCVKFSMVVWDQAKAKMAVRCPRAPHPEKPRPTTARAASSPDRRKLPALGPPAFLTMDAGNGLGDPWQLASAVLLEGKSETSGEGPAGPPGQLGGGDETRRHGLGRPLKSSGIMAAVEPGRSGSRKSADWSRRRRGRRRRKVKNARP
ncbi:hypothetical protein V8C42DRAFT_84498 [Trichoderma barbatum]